MLLLLATLAQAQAKSAVCGAASTAERRVALTVDDLPAMDAMELPAAEITAMNAKLLAALRSAGAPAIGFVIEQNLLQIGEVDARIAVLKSWLDAGFLLGNHTYSHTSLNHAALRDWEDDVVAGENVTRVLLAPRHGVLQYLRFPFLDAGPDPGTKRAAEEFLSGRGYRVAPVTIDGRDWFFADLYADARRRGDAAAEARTVAASLSYTAAIAAEEEALSCSLLGYEPPQVLLLHDSWMEADHLPELLTLLRGRGYRFVSLDEALADPAYAQPDEYISDVGAGSIEHWAATRGRPVPESARPQMPAWAAEAHRALDAAAAAAASAAK